MIIATPYIQYSKVTYKYKLEADFFVYLPTSFLPLTEHKTDYLTLSGDGKLILHKGYCSDGASGPTIDTPSSMRGAFVHDALYQLFRMGLISTDHRLDADQLLYDLTYEDGMYGWRCKLWRRELGKFGAVNADPNKKNPVYIAPKSKRSKL